MNDSENTYLHIGLDFIDAFGVRRTDVSLVRKNGGAIAIASYDDGKLHRCTCIDEVDKTKFLDDARELFGNSIPVTFPKEIYR